MADHLISVLNPFEYVCKQSDAAKNRVGKFKSVRIYDVKLITAQERKHLLKKLREHTRQDRDTGKDALDLQKMVPKYIERLRDEVAEFGHNSDDPSPIQTFEKIAEDLLKKEPAKFSFVTTKTVKSNCFVGLVENKLFKNGDIKETTLYFLEDGVKVSDMGGAVHRGEEEGAVGGAVGGAAPVPEEQQNGPTLVLPRDWRKSFQKSLENKIHLCHGHIGPALEALRLGYNSYTDSEGNTCRFNSSRSKRTLVQGMKKFPDKMSYKLYDKNPQLGSKICKVHLNGDGSDCLLVYVAQNYKQLGRVLLLVGVLTHHECGVKTGAKKKERATQKGLLDITEDMEAAEKYLEKEHT